MRRNVRVCSVRVPVLVFLAAPEVPCIRKCRHPAPLDEMRVPADMIDMQVCADDGVDCLGSKTARGNVCEKRRLQIIPPRNAAALLVVAETRIDNDAPARRLYQKRLHGHFEPPFRIGEMRLQPADFHDLLAACLRQDEACAADDLELDHGRDFDIADLPHVARLPRAVGSIACFCRARNLAADERRPRFDETPGQIGGARDADAESSGDFDRRATHPEGERRLVERQSVMLARDGKRLAKPPRTGAKQTQIVEPASFTHDFDTAARLEWAYQPRVAARLAANEIQTPMDAVGAIDIGMSGRPEHRRIALRAAAETVRGGLGVIIGFGLDDTPADAIGEHADADEIARHIERASPEEIGLERGSLRRRSPRSHVFLSRVSLCTAVFPDLSLFTLYSGLFFGATALWPLIMVGLVCFLTKRPCVSPCDVFHLTLSPYFKLRPIACFPRPLTRATRMRFGPFRALSGGR